MSFTTRPVQTGHGSVIDRRSAHGCPPSKPRRTSGRMIVTACPTARFSPAAPAAARPSPRRPRFSVPCCPVAGVALGALPDVAAGRDEVPVWAPLAALAALMRAAAAADVRPVDVPLRAPLAALAEPVALAVPVV